MSTPHLIPMKPIGEDFYEGKSHERLAEAIKRYMKSVDIKKQCREVNRMPRLIGLEGKWGSGKSNVIKLLEGKLKEGKYNIFTFDAWSHQEDLQRRAFLYDLTNYLIENKLLKGPTKRKVLQTDGNEKDYLLEEECSWKQRRETLVARKSFTRNSKLPIINNDSKWFALTLLLTGIIPSIMNAMRTSPTWCYWWVLVLIVSLLPIALFLISMIMGNKKRGTDFKQRWNAMWRFYTASEASETTTMSISEPEPSPSEFKQWMNDVNDALGWNRLVVVFDNMDRLPSHKIRDLWSSINTFFADVEYINVWCIIPFDYNRLSKAFDSEEKGKQEERESLTDKFIKKTFPVVFRVPAPVFSDYKKMFDDYAKQAFGGITLDENVSLLYRSNYTNPNPRDIIFFINKLITLYNQWNGEVKIENMAIYILNEKNILENPEENILNGKYLGDKHLFLTDNDERRAEIAVLVYGVGKEWARQIPVKRFIENSMASQPDVTKINKIVKQTKSLFTVLHDMIAELEPKKDLFNMIRFIEVIEDADGNLVKDWSRLAEYYNGLSEIQYNQNLNELLSLIRHNKPDTTHSLVNTFCNSIKRSNGKPDGSSLYEILEQLDNAVKDIDPDISIPEFKLEGDDFICYVQRAKREYKRFNVTSPKEKVNEAIFNSIDGMSDSSYVLEILVDDDNYNFDPLNDKLRDLAVEANRAKEHLNLIFRYLRIINKGLISFEGKPLNNLLKTWGTMNPEDLAYIDIATVLCVNGHQVKAIAETDLKHKEDIIYRYTATETLWELSANNNPALGLKSIMAYCIKSKKTFGDFPKDNVLSKMNFVKIHTGSSYEELINFVDAWGYVDFGPNDSDSSKIRNNFNSADWVKAFADYETPFTNCVLQLFKKKLAGLKESEIKRAVNNGKTNYDPYWVTVVESLNKRNLLEDGLPNNLHGIANSLVSNVLKSTNNISLSNFERILLRRIGYFKLNTTNQALLKTFITTDAKFNISKYKLLHPIVEQMTIVELDSSRESFVKCLEKFKDNVDMKGIIKGNPSFYKPLSDAFFKK